MRRLGERDELLELIDEDEEAAVGRIRRTQLAGDRCWIAHEELGERGFAFAEQRCEDGRDRGDGMLTGNELERCPRAIGTEAAFLDERQHACATQRRLTDARVTRNENERLDA